MPRRRTSRRWRLGCASGSSPEVFDAHLTRWDLTPDGEPIATHSSRLLPVRHAGVPAMLKIAFEAEERWGATLMVWWKGDGAVRVLAHEGDALLMERALGEASLVEMARNGCDDEASRIICEVAARLHAPRDRPPPALMPLQHWFQELGPAAARHGTGASWAKPQRLRASCLRSRRASSPCTATSTTATSWTLVPVVGSP
jgi:streptomycin 6-kinase